MGHHMRPALGRLGTLAPVIVILLALATAGDGSPLGTPVRQGAGAFSKSAASARHLHARGACGWVTGRNRGLALRMRGGGEDMGGGRIREVVEVRHPGSGLEPDQNLPSSAAVKGIPRGLIVAQPPWS